MNIASALRSIVLCVLVLGASVETGWCQSQPPAKDQATGNAGSGGKAPDQMGSKEGKESPMTTCDSNTTEKTTKEKKKAGKKQKNKKTESAKSGSSS